MHLKLSRWGFFWVLCAFYLIAVAGCKEARPPKSGDVAPTISCNDIAGEYVNLGDMKNKVVVIYFWSSKCCGDKLRQLEPFYLRHKYSGLSVLAIEVGGAKESVASFVKNSRFTFTNLTDEYGSVSRTYEIIGFPTIFVIDKRGIISKKISGDIRMDQLDNLVSPLL